MASRTGLPFDLILDRSTHEPMHRQLYGALRKYILEGRLEADANLPGSRILAQHLQIGRNTVLSATTNFSPRALLRPAPDQAPSCFPAWSNLKCFQANLPPIRAGFLGAEKCSRANRSPVAHRAKYACIQASPKRGPFPFPSGPGCFRETQGGTTTT